MVPIISQDLLSDILLLKLTYIQVTELSYLRTEIVQSISDLEE